MARLNEAAARIRAANPLGKEYSEALARGLAVLTSFDGAQGGLTLSDVANRIGVPRATARRALLTLVALGYAQEHNRVFRLTPRVLRIASAYLNCNVATAVLQPHCEALAAQHAAIFSVAALDDGDAVMIAYATA